MKYQVLFFSEKKKKYSRLSSAAVVFGTLRVKAFEYTFMFLHHFCKTEQFCDFLFASLDD